MDYATRKKPLWYLLATTGAILLCLTCWPVFAGKWNIYGDIGALHIPVREFLHRQMSSGILPLWDPRSYGGFYIHGEGQAGLLHPFHLVAYHLLSGPAETQVEITLVYLLMLTGSFALFRRWSVSSTGALLGALAFTFAGAARTQLPHVMGLAVMAHIPWLLLCTDHLFRDGPGRGRWSLAISLLNGSAILAGYPPYHLFVLIFQAWYLLWFFGQPDWWRRTFQFAAAAAAGALLGAPQWLPTLIWSGGSSRVRATYHFLIGGSWHPLNLLGFANPALFADGFWGDNLPDEMKVYPGAGVILLAAFAVLHAPTRARHARAIRMLVALAIFGLVLSLGQYGKIYDFWLLLPGVRYFRVPVRYFWMVQFALAGLCGIALDPFLRRKSHHPEWRRQSAPALLMAVGALITLGIAWEAATTNSPFMFSLLLRRALPRADISNWPAIVAGAAMVLALCICYVLALKRGGGWAKAAIVILLADIGWYAGSQWLAYPTGTTQDIIAEADRPDLPPPARVSPPDDDPNQGFHLGKHRWFYAAWMTNLYSLAGYRSTNGYTGLSPHGALPLESDAYKLLMGSQAIWRSNTLAWERVADPIPPVRLTTQLVQSSNPERDVARIDFRRQALVAAPQPVDLAATGTARLIETSSQESQVVTETSGAMLCILAQRFHSGWKAKSDGHEVALFPVYGDLTGFLAPAGSHTTTLRFAPADLTYGLWLAGVGLVLASLLTVLARGDGSAEAAPAPQRPATE